MRSPLELMLPLITHPACVQAEAQHVTASATMRSFARPFAFLVFPAVSRRQRAVKTGSADAAVGSLHRYERSETGRRW
jgi:hypothetical protein